MHCVSCVTIGLIGFVSDKCSFVVAFVDGLSDMDVPFYGSITFCFLVSSDCYILLFVAWCPMVAEEFLFTSARRRDNKYDFS